MYRADMADRGDRADMADMADRADRADMADMADRADRADTAYRADSADRAGKSEIMTDWLTGPLAHPQHQLQGDAIASNKFLKNVDNNCERNSNHFVPHI